MANPDVTPRQTFVFVDNLNIQRPAFFVFKASTPRKSDLGSSVGGAFETSLFDDKEDFSNIFDDFDIS